MKTKGYLFLTKKSQTDIVLVILSDLSVCGLKPIAALTIARNNCSQSFIDGFIIKHLIMAFRVVASLAEWLRWLTQVPHRCRFDPYSGQNFSCEEAIRSGLRKVGGSTQVPTHT
jgi:hypothetical protein